MGVKVTNNAYGTLSAGISTSDTTITLDSGQGARFPTLGADDYFFATLIDTSNNIEIVKVTARSTDSMTVTRGQDNTTATAFAIGDRFELRPVAALFEGILDEGVSTITNDGYIVHKSASSNPSSPDAGQVYYNTTDKVLKHWDGSEWIQMSNTFSAEGGTEVTSGGYKYHTFTSSGTFTVTSGSKNVELLLVAGGAAGGNGTAGGGGAGGYLYQSSVSLSTQSYSIVIGAGGTGGNTTNSVGVADNGDDSTALGYTAVGGGAGAGTNDNATYAAGNGGSGGGGAGYPNQLISPGTGTSGQGNDGGSVNSTDRQSGAGGGGAGAAGQSLTTGTNGGNGGAGKNSQSAWATATSTGDSGYYAGGGGGGTNGTAGAGGSGGGGDGIVDQAYTASVNNGAANTGGGGGGSWNWSGSQAGNGGSGICIIRYQL